MYPLVNILTYFDSIPIPIEQAAENIGKMGISAAMAMGNIVKTKIEEEIHKHQQHPEEGEEGDESDERGASGTSSDGGDAVGGEDIQEEEDENGEEGTADESRILISQTATQV